jgi:hypothetical protein
MWNDIGPLAAAADKVNSNGFIFIVPLLDY